jgi:hypothetical protein
MSMLPFLILGLLVALVWVAFVSWFIGRIAFLDEPPMRRAALTAGASLAIACGIQIVLVLLFGTSWLRPVPFYAAAAVLDFLMLWRGFERKWVPENDAADAFL